MLVRQPGDEPVFKFSLTKRRGRAGMQDANGDFKGDIIVRHARDKGQIRWEYGQIEPASPEPDSDSKRSRVSTRRSDII